MADGFSPVFSDFSGKIPASQTVPLDSPSDSGRGVWRSLALSMLDSVFSPGVL